MTSPLPGPSMPMPGPDAAPITVPVKPCCGDRLINDECDCLALAAELAAAPTFLLAGAA